MDKRNTIIICLVIILITVCVIGAILSFNQYVTTDFGEITVSVPVKAEFVSNSTNDNMRMFVDNKLGLTVEYMNTKTIEGVGGALSVRLFEETGTQLSNEKLDNKNATLYKTHKLDTGEERYMAVYNPEGHMYVVIAPDIDTVIHMMNSLKIKNNTAANNDPVDINSNSASPTPTSHDSNSASSTPTNHNSNSKKVVSNTSYDAVPNHERQYSDAYYEVEYDDGSFQQFDTSTGELIGGDGAYIPHI